MKWATSFRFSSRELSDIERNYCQLLGEISIGLAYIENELHLLANVFSGNEALVEQLVTGKMIGQLITVLRATFNASKFKKSEQDAFIEIMERVDDVLSLRNDNIHALWQFDPVKQEADRFKYSLGKHGSINAESVKFNMSLQELESSVKEIWALHSDIMLMRMALTYDDPSFIDQEPQRTIFLSIKTEYENRFQKKNQKNENGKKKGKTP